MSVKFGGPFLLLYKRLIAFTIVMLKFFVFFYFILYNYVDFIINGVYRSILLEKKKTMNIDWIKK